MENTDNGVNGAPQMPDEDKVNRQFNQQFNQQFGGFPSGSKELPNATGVLVLGIISIVGCFCYGIVGIITGVIALALAGTATRLYKENPELYTPNSFKNMKAGRICAIIGLCLSIAYLLVLIIVLSLGLSLAHNPLMFR